MKMKRFLISSVAFILCISAMAAPKKSYTLVSPDGKLSVSINVDNKITYTLEHDGDLLLDKSAVSMSFTDGTSFNGVQPVKKVTERTVYPFPIFFFSFN